jgi:5-methylcytosine-specific restriction endonuclease McrA
MRARSLVHLSNGILLTKLDEAETRDRSGTAELLGYLAEVDRRLLYLPAGYPSMFAWCVETRHYSEDVASKRIRAARAARTFPVILDMLADGRLHLSGVSLVSRRLTRENADALLGACVHRSKRAIELMLAERFPEADTPTRVQSIASASSLPAPGPVKDLPVAPSSAGADSVAAAAAVGTQAPGPALVPAVPTPACSSIAPTAPQRFKAQFTMDETMYADLQRALELLGPQAGEDRVREVFRRALQALVTKLEKQKFAATEHPRAQRGSSKTRHIPAAIKREVSKRDGHRCTFMSQDGRRCGSRDALEFDHVLPVALGGMSTLENLRLLCRAHNQYEADRAFGAGFMHRIREPQSAANIENRTIAPGASPVWEPATSHSAP